MQQNTQKFVSRVLILLLISFLGINAQTTVINDPLQGSTKGKQVGGSLTSEGFKPRLGKYHKSGTSEDHILYEVTKANGGKVIENGYVEFQVKGFRMSDFASTSSSLPSREHGFMVLYDGRGVSEPLRYDPDSKHNYFYWVIHYRSEKYQSTAGNKWKTIINCAEPISARLNSSRAVFTDATGDLGIVNAKDGKLNLLDRDWTVEPNGLRTSWDPNKWYTIRVEWNNKSRQFKVYRDGSLVWFNEREEGKSWSSYNNSINPAPYPWRPQNFKIWLGSGTGRYDNDMKNIVYRNFKVVDLGGSSPPPPTTPAITVNSPNGGENIKVGSSYQIKWSSSNVSNVKIEFSSNNGSSWSAITNSTSSDGSHTWNVPNNPSSNCLIRITDTGSSTNDKSNSKFTISEDAPPPPPSGDALVVTSPNGGENFAANSVQQITWTSPSDVKYVNIFFTSNSGASWTKIDFIPNTGAYNWNVPNISSNNCVIRVKDAYNQAHVDWSDSEFSISKDGSPPPPPPPPSGDDIVVTSPNGGENFGVNTTQVITWTSPSDVKYVNIFFSSNYNPSNPTAATWKKLDYVANTGSFSWKVPNTTSNNCVIRVKDGNGKYVDWSDAVFKISKDGSPTPPSGSEMKVTSPNGGENLAANSNQTITWTTPSGVTHVNIFFSSNYKFSNPTAATWTKVDYVSNTGSFTWKVPNVNSSNCVIRIKDAYNQSNVDWSDANFSISGAGSLAKDGNSDLNEIEEIPEDFALEQNYPNPFNPVTRIRFSLAKPQNVKITVYNLMGEQIKVLVNRGMSAGSHDISFDGSNLASGTYIYRMVSEEFVSTKRMTLIK